MTSILGRLRTGAPPAQASLDRGLDVVRVLDAIYRSSEAGGRRTELA